MNFLGHTYNCAIGKNGTTANKIRGRQNTLRCFTFRIYYRKKKIPELKFGLDSEIINHESGWCDDPKSEFYNSFVKLPINVSTEKLLREDDLYDLIFVINYNSDPVVRNKGSAIFMHIAKPNYDATEGCIALIKNDLIAISEQISPATKILIED